jgi:hypothetical protein
MAFFFAKAPGMAATIKIRNKTPTSRIARIASETTSRTPMLTLPLKHAYLPAQSESGGDDAGQTVALESALIMGA